MVSEAIKSSEIEGEMLSRPDVMSSIKNNLGLNPKPTHVGDRRAEGIAELMVCVRNDYAEPASREMLFEWRALSDKALSQGIGRPVLLSLSQAIETDRAAYYAALKQAQRSTDISEWIFWFSRMLLHAQETGFWRTGALINRKLTHSKPILMIL